MARMGKLTPAQKRHEEGIRLRRLVKRLCDVISSSAPLTWAAHSDLTAAHRWEHRADSVLEEARKYVGVTDGTA